MKAIGTLAGGVAHDLNNVLSGIVSYPELILMDLTKDSPIRDSIMIANPLGSRSASADPLSPPTVENLIKISVLFPTLERNLALVYFSMLFVTSK